MIRSLLLTTLLCTCTLFGWGQPQSLDALELRARKTYGPNLDSSFYYTDQVLQLAPDSGNTEKYAWALNWKAICFLKINASDSVNRYLDACIAYCDAHDLPQTKSKALLNRVINYQQQSNYEASIETGLSVLRLFETLNDTLGVAHACYNTGVSYFRMGFQDRAYAMYQRALTGYLSNGSVLNIARTYNAIGTINQVKSKHDSAIFFFRKAAEAKEAIGGWSYCGSEYSNIAVSNRALQRYAEASAASRISLKAFTAQGDKRGIALLSGNLSRLKFTLNELDSAIYYGRIAYAYADTLDDLHLISENAKAMSVALEAAANYKLSLQYQKVHKLYQDSFNTLEGSKNVRELTVQYQTEKQQKELALAQAANLSKDYWILFWVSITIVFLGLALWLIYRYITKKKALLREAKIALEQEKNRISMDLHDHLGAELTIISSQLDMEHFKAENEDLKSRFASLADQSRAVSSQLRETIWSVKSPSIDLQQFEIRVRDFAQRILGNSTTFSCQTKGQLTLESGKALDLFRVIQEAINNVKKHSRATAVSLVMDRHKDCLIVQLIDNGIGFDPTQPFMGNGLKNIYSRMEQHQGTARYEKQATGMLLQLELPLKS